MAPVATITISYLYVTPADVVRLLASTSSIFTSVLRYRSMPVKIRHDTTTLIYVNALKSLGPLELERSAQMPKRQQNRPLLRLTTVAKR